MPLVFLFGLIAFTIIGASVFTPVNVQFEHFQFVTDPEFFQVMKFVTELVLT